MPVPQATDPLARTSDLALLHPAFRSRVELVLARARAEGLPVYLFEGKRSYARQEALYAQGRTLPGPVVTNARGDCSWHQYGLAGDFAFDGDPTTERVEWTWNGNWAKLGVIIQTAGLEWYGAAGSPFREAPHAQMRAGLNLANARFLKAHGGLKAVWDEIDRRLAKGA